MELTQEQKDIIHSTGDIKINAVAGSGKTTTIIEYAKAKPKTSKILYLAFNKSVKLEAQRRFRELGLGNVKVETAHSLAYKNIVFKYGYRVKGQGYKTNEIVEMLGLKGNGERYTEYIVANHINKLITYFCNSDKRKVRELNYVDTLSDPKAKAFAGNMYQYIERQTRLFLAKMDQGQIDILHDFYLKKFQLFEPKLRYDYILFDEGQDASSAMLDLVLKQDATKVIVGDTHQQIYSWRYAVNSLEKADFKSYQLTNSFRFNQNIANLAKKILTWKDYISDNASSFPIKGLGETDQTKSRAVLARTNLGLLLKAIEHVTEKQNAEAIYFEGNIYSYTYADEGTSLYDVLNLYNKKYHLIRDKLINKMKKMDDLEDYVNKTEDAQLSMMIEIVKEYGNQIPSIIEEIKEKHIGNDDEKDKAEMIFSTVHKSKGMEYDTVQLVDDFICEDDLEKISEKKDEEIDIGKINEEINLLYVAMTRAKNSLYIPEEIFPDDFPESPNVHVLKESAMDGSELAEISGALESTNTKAVKKGSPKEKAYSYEEIRKTHKSAYKRWTQELDDELTLMYGDGIHMKDLAKHFGRTKGAIRSRIKKLELKEKYG